MEATMNSEFDPHEAAAVLEQTSRKAEREFDLRPPLLTLAAAAIVLIAYGAVWFGVRHQHPYTGPTGAALGELYGTLAVWVLLNVLVLGRALSGRSSRQRRLEGFTFAAIWICVYIFQGALYHTDHSHAIAYGIYPAVGPLLLVGAASAGYQLAREKFGEACFSVAAVAVGAIAPFAGPRGVWGITGICLSALCLAGAAAQLWRRRLAVQ
jgi:hypothetical protein